MSSIELLERMPYLMYYACAQLGDSKVKMRHIMSWDMHSLQRPM